MKIDYIIFNRRSGDTQITFADKNNAEAFLRIKNAVTSDYYIKERPIYENFEEYVQKNQDRTTEVLNNLNQQAVKVDYMIYNRYYGDTQLSFDNKKSAEEFLNTVPNDFYLKERVVYQSLDQYVKQNEKGITDVVLDAINNIRLGAKEYRVNLTNGCTEISFADMKNIVKNNKIDFKTWKGTVYDFEADESDLEIITNKYIEVKREMNNELAIYDALLEEFKKLEDIEEEENVL